MAYHQLILMHGHPNPTLSTIYIYTLYSRMECSLFGGHSLIVFTVLISCSDPHGMQQIVNEQALAF